MSKPLNPKYVRVLKRLIPVYGMGTLYAIEGRLPPYTHQDYDRAYADASHVIAVKSDLEGLSKPNSPVVMRVRLKKSRVKGCIEDWFLITKNGVTKSYNYYSFWHKEKPEYGEDRFKYLRQNETVWIVKEDPLPNLPHYPIPIYDSYLDGEDDE